MFREISVREYSKLRKISAPTASTILKALETENLLLKEKKEFTYILEQIRGIIYLLISLGLTGRINFTFYLKSCMINFYLEELFFLAR